MPILIQHDGLIEPTYYLITSVEFHRLGSEVVWKAQYRSYPNYAMACLPGAGFDTGTDFGVPLVAAGDPISAYEQMAITSRASRFHGGSIVAPPDEMSPLDMLKRSAWQRVKALRDAKEFGPFAWGGRVFDGDTDAQRRINLAVMGAQVALSVQQPWAIDWTLSDNTSVVLSGADMVAVAEALGQNIAQAHASARVKRALIDAAATSQELEVLDLGAL